MSKVFKDENNQTFDNKDTELTEEMLTEVNGGFGVNFLDKHCHDCVYYVEVGNKCKLGLKGGGDTCKKHTVAM